MVAPKFVDLADRFLDIAGFLYISSTLVLTYLLSITVIPDLFYIMDQAVDQPLGIHLGFPSESKPVQAFIFRILANTGSAIASRSG